MKKRKFRTDFLLPKNSFLIGMGSSMNVSGNYFRYKTSSSSRIADFNALSSDWQNIGEDMRISIEKIKNA